MVGPTVSLYTDTFSSDFLVHKQQKVKKVVVIGVLNRSIYLTVSFNIVFVDSMQEQQKAGRDNG